MVAGLKAWVKSVVSQSRVRPQPESFESAPSPFLKLRRVALYQVKWPRGDWHPAHAAVQSQLESLTKELSKTIVAIEGQGYQPVLGIARLVGYMSLFGLLPSAMVEFSKSIIEIISNRKNSLIDFQVDLVDEAAFCSEILRVRCALWIILDLFGSEARILLNASRVLGRLCSKVQPTGPGFSPQRKILITPYNIFVIPFLIIDQIENLRDVLRDEATTSIPSLMRHLFENSGAICLHYSVHGSLDGHFLALKMLDQVTNQRYAKELRSFMEAVVHGESEEDSCRNRLAIQLRNELIKGFFLNSKASGI